MAAPLQGVRQQTLVCQQLPGQLSSWKESGLLHSWGAQEGRLGPQQDIGASMRSARVVDDCPIGACMLKALGCMRAVGTPYGCLQPSCTAHAGLTGPLCNTSRHHPPNMHSNFLVCPALPLSQPAHWHGGKPAALCWAALFPALGKYMRACRQQLGHERLFSSQAKTACIVEVAHLVAIRDSRDSATEQQHCHAENMTSINGVCSVQFTGAQGLEQLSAVSNAMKGRPVGVSRGGAVSICIRQAALGNCGQPAWPPLPQTMTSRAGQVHPTGDSLN